MQKKPTYATVGSETKKINIRLSYGIVSLFSEGLYASPHKALEELVANSFDAGARKVAVIVPVDWNAQGVVIAVADDGIGMDAAGLEQHWLIGKSLKRELSKLPLGRQQIGKFGIGKLATYVLANRLTHITKAGSTYYATTMDFKEVDRRGEKEVEVETPVKISLRELTAAQAKEALNPWLDKQAMVDGALKLFGPGAAKSWTFAILSDLKDKVHQIQPGKLAWVMRTALPLRDDFEIFLNGEKLQPSKAGRARIKKWVLGKEIDKLAKPASSSMEVNEDKRQPSDSPTRYGLQHKSLGRVTGYAEAYRDLLTTGKSNEIGRSYGFFVYVRGRLINVDDGHFGIPPNELRHGSFGRMRVVVHIEGLDQYLQSDRERVREGPVLRDAQNLLRAIFNKVRVEIEKTDAADGPNAKLSRSLAGSPASLSRRPIVSMTRAIIEGRFTSKYVSVPALKTKAQRDALLATLEKRVQTPETFVTGMEFLFDGSADLGIALYDVESGVLCVNGFHPFVASFLDQFTGSDSGLPLELLAMAEVLLEGQLHEAGYAQSDVDKVMFGRDQYLRDVAQSSGRRTALTVANALQDARNDDDRLEAEVVAAFNSLGFSATRDGRKGKADGIARAELSADAMGPRHYSLSLEAKSTRTDGKTIAASTVNISLIAQHRDENQCEHALVVGPSFPTTQGDAASVSKQIDKNIEQTKASGQPKTITLITIDDLARLVRLQPIKGLGLSKLRSLFLTCRLPEQCREWIDTIERHIPPRQPYKEVVDSIHKLQQKFTSSAVEYGSLRVELSHRNPPIEFATNEGLIDLCRAMMAMAQGFITATATTVELDQSPTNVLTAIESATKQVVRVTTSSKGPSRSAAKVLRRSKT